MILTIGTSGDNYGRYGIGQTIEVALRKGGMKKREPFRAIEAETDDPGFFSVEESGVTWKRGVDVTVSTWRSGKVVKEEARKAKAHK